MKCLFDVDYPGARSVRSIVFQLVTPRYLWDDAYAVGLMALVEAERENIPARIVIRSRLLDFLRAEGFGPRAKKPRAAEAVSFDRPADEFKPVAAVADPSIWWREIVAREWLPVRWRHHLRLNELLVLSAECWGDRCNADIAIQMGLHQSRVSAIRASGLRRLRVLVDTWDTLEP